MSHICLIWDCMVFPMTHMCSEQRGSRPEVLPPIKSTAKLPFSPNILATTVKQHHYLSHPSMVTSEFHKSYSSIHHCWKEFIHVPKPLIRRYSPNLCLDLLRMWTSLLRWLFIVKTPLSLQILTPFVGVGPAHIF